MEKPVLLLLGGLHYLRPVIDAAHRLGLYVVTADYLPDNPAHQWSDRYVNVSVTDRQAVLAVARELGVAGIMSFAVDPGVTTAAYVAEKLGLPFQGPVKSVEILQDKWLFRHFLEQNDFNTPHAITAASPEQALRLLSDPGYRMRFPVMVKPTDSAGSKGVSFVESFGDGAQLIAAVETAAAASRCGMVIVEEYIPSEGNPSGSECFSHEGRITFCSFSSQRFDPSAPNPFAPAGHEWPSAMPQEAQREICRELQRLFSLLGLRTGIYNVESRLGRDGKVYIMEVSPRGGGNRVPEVVGMAAEIDLVENAVRAAVGMELDPRLVNAGAANAPLAGTGKWNYSARWGLEVIHTNKEEVFSAPTLSDRAAENLVELDLLVKPGEKVGAFDGAHRSIGCAIYRL